MTKVSNAFALVILIAAFSAAQAADELIPGKIGIIKPSKLAKFVAKAPVGSPFNLPPAASASDPSANGATLRFLDTVLGTSGGDVTYSLPAGAAWKLLGNPPGAKGYKYKGAGTPSDPCKVVIIKATVIKAVCKSTAVAFTFPIEGDLGIRLAVGTGMQYCVEFGGTNLKNGPSVFKSKAAPAPAGCSEVLPTPTPTNTFTPTNTRTPTSTPTITNTPTETGTPTNTPTVTNTFTPTNTRTPTNTPSQTATPSITGTPTQTPVTGTCSFDSGVDDSKLNICIEGACPFFGDLNISGAMDIGCGDPDVNQKRACSFDLLSFAEVPFGPIGDICVEAAPGCPDGEYDCDGGNALNIDSTSDAQIGLCTSNAQCATQCGVYCTGLSSTVLVSACEGFCQGGDQADETCICDAQPAASCTATGSDNDTCEDQNPPGGTNGGSCAGKDDNDAGGDFDCQCVCVNEGFAPASPAGTMQGRLGTKIRVETPGTCDNAGVLVRLPPLCGPLTSGTTNQVYLDSNEDAPPNVDTANLTGNALACATFDTNTTTNLQLVSALSFFDSVVGDVSARLLFDCQ